MAHNANSGAYGLKYLTATGLERVWKMAGHSAVRFARNYQGEILVGMDDANGTWDQSANVTQEILETHSEVEEVKAN